jgi:hypothetical protein
MGAAAGTGGVGWNGVGPAGWGGEQSRLQYPAKLVLPPPPPHSDRGRHKSDLRLRAPYTAKFLGIVFFSEGKTTN